MKKILITLVAALSLAACATKDKKTTTTNSDTAGAKIDTAGTNTTPVPDTANFTTIEWIDPIVKELGKLKKDREIEVTFRFKNSGTKNLVIQNVTAACGCTIPEKPEQPFTPGQEGVIKAKFNGSGSGTISKTVTVTANTSPQQIHTLTFTGEIKD